MDDILTDEYFIGHLHDHKGAIITKSNNIIDIGTITNKFIFFQCCTCKALFAVHIEFFIGSSNLCRLDIVETAQLSPPVAVLPEFLPDLPEIFNGIIDQVSQVIIHLFHLDFNSVHYLIGPGSIVTRDALNGYFSEPVNILLRYLPDDLLCKGFQSPENGSINFFGGLAFLNSFVNLIFDKYFLKGTVVQLIKQFLPPDIEFQFQQVEGSLCIHPEYFGNTHEPRFSVFNYTGVRRDGDLAFREGIKCIHGGVRGNPCCKVNQYLHIGGCIVIDLPDLDLALVIGREDGIDDGSRSGAIGDFADHQGFLILQDYFGAQADLPAPKTIIVPGNIDHAAGEKIGEEFELFFLQDFDGGIDELVEVMRKYL